MELLQLKYFCDAAESENFSRTAQKYIVPPSNISQTVKRLEAELGTELFDRRSNRISLNEKGRAFYSAVRTALDMIEDARISITDTDECTKGEIRLLALSNRRAVTEAIEIFKRKYPEVSFILDHRDDGSRENYDIIISDDEALVGTHIPHLLVTEDILLAVSARNPLAACDTISADMLARERFISMNEGSSLSRIFRRICSSLGFAPTVTVRTDDPYYVRKYVELDMGIAIVPSFSWQSLFGDGVVFKRIGNFSRSTYAFIRRSRYSSRTLSLFFESLKEAFK